MGETLFITMARRASGLARHTIEQIAAINRKYATPHVKTTPLVRVALLLLRLYLLSLVGILIFKFITLLR
ncbi:MAG TPA: hypothetical protein VMU02_10715 [bacterium]|nr:hypothetical protein [bacterium]